MAIILTIFSWLIIISWPCLLFLSYTMFGTQTRFVLQTLFILPNALITSLICCFIGFIVKFGTFELITKQRRIFFLSWITQQCWQYLLFTFEFWPNLKYVVSDEGVSHDIFHLNNIIICNHNATPFDWIAIATFSDYLGRFQNAFSFMKKAFAYVPAVGWIGSLHAAIGLDRVWEKDKITIKTLCQKFKSTTGDYRLVTPWSFLCYPEGTRFTQKKLLAAQQFAKDRGFPVYEHILQPRVKGFSYLTHHLYDVLGDIIDVTCLYRPKPPKPKNFFWNTRLCRYAHLHLRVYRQKELPQPTDDNDLHELDQWLRDRWTEKDDIMDKMKKNQMRYKILKRSPWRAIRYYVAWTCIIMYLFSLIFKPPFPLAAILLISALFPVIIVLTEYTQTLVPNALGQKKYN